MAVLWSWEPQQLSTFRYVAPAATIHLTSSCINEQVMCNVVLYVVALWVVATQTQHAHMYDTTYSLVTLTARAVVIRFAALARPTRSV